LVGLKPDLHSFSALGPRPSPLEIGLQPDDNGWASLRGPSRTEVRHCDDRFLLRRCGLSYGATRGAPVWDAPRLSSGKTTADPTGR